MLLTELPRSGPNLILAAGVRYTEELARDPSRWASSGGPCSLADLADQSDVVFVFEERFASDVAESAAALLNEIPTGKTGFIALVPRAEAPAIDAQYCEPITSFLCSTSVFSEFLGMGIECHAETLCFAVLRAIANGDVDVDRLMVRQIPYARHRVISGNAEPAALVLPHRGDASFLQASLKYIERAAGKHVKARVGLDVDDETEYTRFPENHPDVDFFRFGPAPVGPYLIRQELAERSPEPYLILQDSDDLSCYDRFAVLHEALAQTSEDCIDIVGSHELCLDEMRALVQPVRFPLDSSGSLAICPNHALLHATLMCHRDAFFRAGGLATNLIIASDTQFLLRAYFSTRIRNVDEFLYIRRRHATSLTNAPETIYDNPLRRRLSAEWTRDFDAVKRGELRLESSTLWPLRRLEPFDIELLTAQNKLSSVTA